MTSFNAEEFLPQSMIEQVTEIRMTAPSRIEQTAKKRRQRTQTAPSGCLNLLIADQPARRHTNAGANPLALADRYELLSRIIAILSQNLADGIIGSIDLLEELFILDSLRREQDKPSILDDKLMIATLNRGGLSGTIWELEDPMTGPSLDACTALRLDATRIVLRISPHSSESLKTLTSVADMLRQTTAANLPTFLEPIAVDKAKLGYDFVNDPTALARIVGVATGLGNSSRGMWLTVPHCENMTLIGRTTTLPILVNCDHSERSESSLLGTVSSSLDAAKNIRGVLMGTNVLFPANDNPVAVATGINHLVQKKATSAKKKNTE